MVRFGLVGVWRWVEEKDRDRERGGRSDRAREESPAGEDRVERKREKRIVHDTIS